MATVTIPSIGEEQAVIPISKTPNKWTGRNYKGKWYCNCNLLANCRPVMAAGSKNKGKKFWSCPKAKEIQCRFFLWDEDHIEARALRHRDSPPPAPATDAAEEPKTPPKRKAAELATPGSGVTPWTLSKKRCMSRENSDEQSKNENSALDPFVIEDDNVQGNAQVGGAAEPSATKSVRFPSGLTFDEKMKECAAGLPTPESRPKATQGEEAASTKRAREESPTPLQPRTNASPGQNPSIQLTEDILNLLRGAGIDLKGLKDTTMIEMQYRIRLQLEVNEARIRSLEERDLAQKKKIDELQAQQLAWMGDPSSWDDVSQ